MGYLDRIRNFIQKFQSLIGSEKVGELQPKDILTKLFKELENRKKLGIEENAFVPNVYSVYLSPSDYEELSPLLSGIKEQLKNKLMERIKKQDYRLLSNAVSLEIREDTGLEKNQVVVESSFLKEKSKQLAIKETVDDNKIIHLETTPASNEERVNKTTLPDYRPPQTKIIEDKKTKIIDNTKLSLEIVEGEGQGSVIALKDGEYTFGRGKDAMILIKDSEDTVSRVHFKIIVKEGEINIRDMNSSNGTRINDIEIEEAELNRGDTITAGKVFLKVA